MIGINTLKLIILITYLCMLRAKEPHHTRNKRNQTTNSTLIPKDQNTQGVKIIDLSLTANTEFNIKLQEEEKMTLKEKNLEDQIQTPLYVHLIPHSHQDAGWLMSPEQYFDKYVKKIYNSLLKYLPENKEKTFVISDIYFFQHWWSSIDKASKEIIKKIIKEGRIEFATGGWVSTDEACVSYNEIIDNMYVGRKFLKEEFGIVPEIAWYIDEFGHSSINAKLFSQIGFKYLILGRDDITDKEERKSNQSMQFIWQPQFSNSNQEQIEIEDSIFVSYLFEKYEPPPMIKLENLFQRASFEGSKREAASNLLQYIYNMSLAYKTNQLLIPMGNDFAFIHSYENFEVIDELISIFSKTYTKVHIFYSTLTQYFDALNKNSTESNISWPTYHNDFFPLMEKRKQYWTGYYSSRPLMKKKIVNFESLVYTATSLMSYSLLNNIQRTELVDESQKLIQFLSLLMHHDSITGTSPAQTINDMLSSIDLMEKETRDFLYDEIIDLIENYGIDVEVIGLCSIKKEFEAIGYSLNTDYNKQFCLPKIIKDSSYNTTLIIFRNPSLYIQQIPPLTVLQKEHYYIEEWNQVNKKFQSIYSEKYCIEDKKCDLYVNGTVPPLSLRIFGLRVHQNSSLHFVKTEEVKKIKEVYPSNFVKPLILNNEKVNLTLKHITTRGNALFTYSDLELNMTKDFEFEFRQYISEVEEEQGAGIYVFHSHQQNSEFYSHYYKYHYFQKGKLLDQLIIVYSNIDHDFEYFVKIKLFKGILFSKQIEFDVFFGRISNSDPGKEVTINWKIHDFNNEGKFYTDANNLKMIERHARNVTIQEQKLIQKPASSDNEKEQLKENINALKNNYTFSVAYHVPANFYPVNTAIVVSDSSSNISLCIMNDRPQAGSAYQKDRIELILNRRIYTDDDLGAANDLNEVDLDYKGLNVTAKFYLAFSDNRESLYQEIFDYQLKRLMQVQMFFATKYDMLNQTNSVNPQQVEDIITEKWITQGIRNVIIYPTSQNPPKFNVRLTFIREGIKVDFLEIAQDILELASPGKTLDYGIKVTQKSIDGIQEINLLQNTKTEGRQIQVFEIEVLPNNN